MVSVCHINVRSLVAPGRLEELKFFVSTNDIDVLCLTETWLKPKHANSILELPGFQPPDRCDRPVKRGGGVAIYVRNGLAISPIKIFNNVDIECLAVQIDLPKRKKLLVFAVYRPPDQDVCAFLDALDTAISPHLHRNICLVGDFNAKHTAWFANQGTNIAGENLKLFTDSHDLFQIVNGPTYNPCRDSASLLDLIFTNNPTSTLSSWVLPPIADHCPVLARFSLRKTPRPKPYFSTRFIYSKCNLPVLTHSLSETDWSFISSGSVDQASSTWTDVFMSECCKHVPSETVRVNPQSKPWYSNYLRYLGSCRDRLFKRCRGKPCTSTVSEAYRKVRNLFVAEIRAAEKRYFRSLGCTLLSPDLNPQSWWRLAKKACGWSTTKRISALSTDGQLVVTPSEQACIFNSHFQRQCSPFPAAALPLSISSEDTVLFSFTPITAEAVFCKLRKLPSGKSSGHDQISNELLKLAAPTIAEPLAALFNRSLLEGQFPAVWKIGTISPILKEGKIPSEPASYRPVALLSCLSKVLGRLVHDQLVKFCLENNVLPDQQFGFLKGRSTEWQLLTVLEDWHDTLDKGNQIHAAFLDAAKAFDRVDHSVLLSMLSDVGIRGRALAWLHSYLSSRLIQTRVTGSLSSKLPITSGVPQGSVLGPLLFLIYFKDIPSSTKASSALFADDTVLYRKDCQGDHCNLSENLGELAQWTKRTNVTINALKSADLSIGPKGGDCSSFYDGELLRKVTDHDHLGVTISNDLRWTKHINNLLRKVSCGVSLCKTLVYRHHLPSAVIKRFYQSCVRPRLEYCNAVWCGTPKSTLRRLERVQLQVARAIAGVREPMTALSIAGLPTLSWRRRQHCLAMLWRLVNNQGPPQLKELLPLPVSARSARSLRSGHSIEFPCSRSARRLSSFLCIVVPLWNALPSDVVSSSTLCLFCTRLKNHYSGDRFTYGL